MADQYGLLETFESRRRHLRMRLIIAVMVVGVFGHLVGWRLTLAWAAVYIALQLFEVKFQIATKAASDLTPALRRTGLAILFANGVVFGGYAVMEPFMSGPWGVANGGFMLAGAVVNCAMSNRGRVPFLVALSPYFFHFPALAAASIFVGASWQVTVTLLIAGPMILLPTVTLWNEGHRLRSNRDEEQRQRLEAEQANSAKDAFLAMMSHEIRTPLNGVLGMTYAMEGDELSPIQRERLTVLREAGQNLFVILDDILDVSKIEAGKLTLEHIPFDMAHTVRSACASFAPVVEAKGLTFRVNLDADVSGRFYGDPTRIRQILSNLISNASKFTLEGRVEVRMRREEGGVLLSVSDTGVGMTTDQIGNLFRPFEQADVSTTRRFGGTGLGLSISRHLVAAMGGRIDVESVPNAGSTFHIHLPLAAAPAAPTETAAAPVERSVEERDLKILCAEDNVTNQLVIKTLLGQAGLGVTMVSDGAQAVEAWEVENWDLILMDVRMPGMDGPTAASVIRAREAKAGRARTPILALTANVMPHQMDEYRRAGMDAMVGKPIDIARLFEAMDEALSQAPESAVAA